MTADTSNEETPKKHRPRGVTLVALSYLAIGVISLLISFPGLVFLFNFYWRLYSEEPIIFREMGGLVVVIAIIFSVVTLFIAAIFIPIGIGLLKLQRWAPRLAIIVAIISPLLFTIPIVRALDVIFPFDLLLIPIAFNLICVVYLLTKGSRRAFRRPRTLAERRSAETLRRILEKSGNSCGDIGTEESR